MQPTWMSQTEANQCYQHQQIFTASREELILRLYDGAVRFMQQGLVALAQKNWAETGWLLVRAQRIVHYLNLCLDVNAGGDLAKNLEGLYTYILRRLAEGNLEHDPAPINECLGIIKNLRQAWEESVMQGVKA